jgi:hypothetical protein
MTDRPKLPDAARLAQPQRDLSGLCMHIAREPIITLTF